MWDQRVVHVLEEERGGAERVKRDSVWSVFGTIGFAARSVTLLFIPTGFFIVAKKKEGVEKG